MKKRFVLMFTTVFLLTTVLSSVVFADNDPKPTNITKLIYSTRSVKVGKTFELKAYATPNDCDDDALIWTTTNKKIVAFKDRDHTGDDMEFVAKKKGTATITCRISGTNIKKSCKVTVTAKGKAKIKVDETYVEVDLHEWEDLGAKLVGGSYKNRKLSYKVHNKKIAREKNGKVYGKRVGRTKITIRAKANKKIKKVVYVRVERD